MSELLSDPVSTLLSILGPDPDPVIEEMTAYADERRFPTVGRDVGQFLTVATRMVDARRVFEFGSGFGYSAAWFLRGLPDDGEIVLTDYDGENLAKADRFLEQLDFDGTIRYEQGDAIDTFSAIGGTFDIVLIDLEKRQYTNAFSLASERLEPGGVIVADNMMAGPVTPESVSGALRGKEPVDAATAGIAQYIDSIRNAPDFETAFLPLGEGIAVSHRHYE